jgi:hypothetical protein
LTEDKWEDIFVVLHKGECRVHFVYFPQTVEQTVETALLDDSWIVEELPSVKVGATTFYAFELKSKGRKSHVLAVGLERDAREWMLALKNTCLFGAVINQQLKIQQL